MKFEFVAGRQTGIEEWNRINRKLENDLQMITEEEESEENIREYLTEMISCLQTVENGKCEEMLFLMFDKPASMPADVRVEYVYRPTYMATTMLMTAMNRFPLLHTDTKFRNVLYALMNASLARGFCGAGYEEYVGMLDALEIFGRGDTMAFLEKYSDFNERFTNDFLNVVDFLETEICSGNVKDAWSGLSYSERGIEVLKMLRRERGEEYVWYACYGSNMNRERFMEYINTCSDKTSPKEDRPFMFKHDIYFAKASSKWNGGGKAFLDDTSEGKAYGRVYLITRKQFEEIKRQEGTDYRRGLALGEIEGYPVYSFTDMQKNDETKVPSAEYFKTILTGLRECYESILSDTELVQYLINAIIPSDILDVACAIRQNRHYLTNTQIIERCGLNERDAAAAVKWLLDHTVIQQDRRSIRAGHQVTDDEAYFYTKDSSTGRKLIDAMVNAIDEVNAEVNDPVEGNAEGRRYAVSGSRIERSSKNRIEAIRHHGYKCAACGFDYAQMYGDLGRNYIEVHHVNPLAEQEEECIVNPETDLVCLCANCHRMVHRKRNNVVSIEELRRILGR